MDGITILQTITTITEVNKTATSIICLIYFVISIASMIFCYFKGWIFAFLGIISLSACLWTAAIEPLTTEVNLGYDKIVAYVDTSVVTDEQIMTKYKILSKDGEVYTLREREETEITGDIQKEHIHQWEILKTEEVSLFNASRTNVTLQCSECKGEKLVSYAE